MYFQVIFGRKNYIIIITLIHRKEWRITNSLKNGARSFLWNKGSRINFHHFLLFLSFRLFVQLFSQNLICFITSFLNFFNPFLLKFKSLSRMSKWAMQNFLSFFVPELKYKTQVTFYGTGKVDRWVFSSVHDVFYRATEKVALFLCSCLQFTKSSLILRHFCDIIVH